MPETTALPAPPTVSRDAVRVVLFGMPAAGKSSLLGALAEAAQAQEHLLHGRLGDVSHGLAELRQRLYDESPRRTAEEIVPYPVTFEPFADEREGGRSQAVLIDCDGRVANDLLVRRQSLDGASPEGTLAHEVLQADTLILAIDASAPPAQVDTDFQEFGRFLRLLEHSRGQRTEIGGLPVFLVLTKCDLLAHPGDKALDWMERVEERKRQVDHRFQDFLARKTAYEGHLPFGRIDLHLWATAVKRPALADSPPKPREPYGVAELFRQCLHAARDFHRRRRHSHRRLMWTVGCTAALVALLLAGVLWLHFRPVPVNEAADLEARIEAYEAQHGTTVAERFQGTPEQIAQHVAILTEFRNDPKFGKLPPGTRGYVNDQLGAQEEYLDWYRKLLEARPPAEARSLAELDQIEAALKTTLALPHEGWEQTPAALLRDRRLEDAAALRKGVRTAGDWYGGLREDGEALWTFARRQPGTNGASINWAGWQKDLAALTTRAESPPFRDTDRLRGPDSPTWRDSVLRFASVIESRKGWETTRERLRRQLDLSAVLGLGRAPDRPALLDFSPGSFSAADARARLQELRKDYPNFEKELTLDDVSGTGKPDISQRAKSNYQNLLESGREVVLRQIKEAGASDAADPGRRKKVQRWLEQGPDELADWRVLATALRRLFDPGAAPLDPVDELAAFLGRDRFKIKLSRLSLNIPADLGVTLPDAPRDNLRVVHRARQGGKETTVRLEPRKGEYDAQARVQPVTFAAMGDGEIDFEPGDEVWAELPLRKPGEAGGWQFSWIRGRSALYQFEHLSRGAWLNQEGKEPTGGHYYDDLRLMPLGETRIPTVPDLMPVVK